MAAISLVSSLALAVVGCTPVDRVIPSVSAADGGDADATAASSKDSATESGGSDTAAEAGRGGSRGAGRSGSADADGGKSDSAGGAGRGSASRGTGDGGTEPASHGGAGSGAADAGGAGSSAGAAGSGEPSCSDETCDGTDEDCDGVIDEQLERECGPSPAQGACETGSETCSSGTWGECSGAVEPADEVCDAEQVDEDCDGSNNEGCACENGKVEDCPGNDRGPCRPGTRTCVDGRWSTCMDATGPATELCDGVDNDCDGATDDNPTDCESNESCRDGQCECVPNCANKACGSNGCGGNCPNTCDDDERCNMRTSSCECVPQCSGKECGPDGCNGVCEPDDCADQETCSSAGQCVSNCGNGRTDSGEECDDGNSIESDACIACQNAQCGDGYVQTNVEECEVFGGEWAGRCASSCERTAYIRCEGSTNCPDGEVCASTTGNTSQNMCTSTNCSACPTADGYTAACNFGQCMVLCGSGRSCPSLMACIPYVWVDPATAEQTMRDICVPRVR